MIKRLVKKEELIGYRASTASEHARIVAYMLKEVNKVIRMESVLKTICVFLDAFLILAIIGVGEMSTFRQQVLNVVFVILITAYILFNNQGIKNNKLLIKRIQNGEYEVLDCFSYDVDLAPNVANKAAVYIVNNYGQYCDSRFLVDFYAAKESILNKNIPFLLVKIKDKKSVIYELFSSNKIGGI